MNSNNMMIMMMKGGQSPQRQRQRQQHQQQQQRQRQRIVLQVSRIMLLLATIAFVCDNLRQVVRLTMLSSSSPSIGTADDAPSSTAISSDSTTVRRRSLLEQQQEEKMDNSQEETSREEDVVSGERESSSDTTATTHHSQQLDSFGSCLKIKDDNHWLIEWLAYHYHVLPLRHLVVMVDPTSRTDPRPILEIWNSSSTNLTIEIMDHWNFDGAVPEGMDTTSDVVKQHRGPHHKILEQCLKHYKLNLKWNSWIILTDTDEFLSINPMYENIVNNTDNVPSIEEPGSVMKFLKQEMDRGWTQTKQRGDDENENNESATATTTATSQPQPQTQSFPDCLNVWRGQVCNVESTSNDREPYMPPSTDGHGDNNFADNGIDFLTLRWLHRGGVRFPKNMVNIANIPAKAFEELDLLRQGNMHNVMPSYCNKGNRPTRPQSPFQIYHYDGSDEQRNFRQDIRGKYGQRQGGTKPQGMRSCPMHSTDNIAMWLTGFINDIGFEKAMHLLEGVGQVHGWERYTDTNNNTNDNNSGSSTSLLRVDDGGTKTQLGNNQAISLSRLSPSPPLPSSSNNNNVRLTTTRSATTIKQKQRLLDIEAKRRNRIQQQQQQLQQNQNNRDPHQNTAAALALASLRRRRQVGGIRAATTAKRI